MSRWKNKHGYTAEDLLKIAKDSTVTVDKLSNKTINETRAFYKSSEWQDCRVAFLQGKTHICNICQCDLSAPNAPAMNIDHIKPVKYYWHLRVDHANLQIACENCNRRKSNFIGSDSSIKKHVDDVEKQEEYKKRIKKERLEKEQEIERIINSNRKRWSEQYYKKRRTIDIEAYLRSQALPAYALKARYLRNTKQC